MNYFIKINLIIIDKTKSIKCNFTSKRRILKIESLYAILTKTNILKLRNLKKF